MGTFDKDKYDQNYKKEHFDYFGFFAPKGTKEKAQAVAKGKGLKVSEYIRNLLLEAIEKDTQ